MATPPELGSCTWTEIDRRPSTLLVLPLGACEQHGPHLPLDTDTRVAVALAQRLVAARSDAVMGPTVSVGASGEHDGFAGTMSLGTEVLTMMLVELVRSASWATGVVVVNGHGGNADALAAARATWHAEQRRVLAWTPSLPAGGDAHAGRVETSVMLALHPHLVRGERPVGSTEPLAFLLPSLRQHGVKAVSHTGVLGDARGSSAAEGEAVLDQWAHDLVTTVARWHPPVQP